MAKSGIIPMTKQESARIGGPVEVEVTEAMVSAGMSALQDYGAICDAHGSVGDPTWVLKEIYRAMLVASGKTG